MKPMNADNEPSKSYEWCTKKKTKCGTVPQNWPKITSAVNMKWVIFSHLLVVLAAGNTHIHVNTHLFVFNGSIFHWMRCEYLKFFSFKNGTDFEIKASKAIKNRFGQITLWTFSQQPKQRYESQLNALTVLDWWQQLIYG